VALIVPDHTDKAYIEGMLTVLLQRMAFRQCGVLQVSLYSGGEGRCTADDPIGIPMRDVRRRVVECLRC
jgi:hypothetical protein